jgi:hypothetical protein
MTRFESLQYAPAETRRILRERFTIKLRVTRQPYFRETDLAVTPDALALELLAGTAITVNAAWAEAEILHKAVVPSPGEPADFLALEAEGWGRRIWGRIALPRDTRVMALRAPAGEMDALKALVQRVHDKRYEFQAVVRLGPELDALVRRVEADSTELERMVVQTPAWVAARLWERVSAQTPAPDTALRRWSALWDLLQHPQLVPTQSWTKTDADAFRESVLAALESEPGFGDWEHTRDLYARQLAVGHGVPLATAEARVPAAGPSLVDKALWIDKPMVEECAFGSLEATSELSGLMGLLLADIEAQDVGPTPNPLMQRLIDLAVGRAELLISLLFQVRAKPVLLADLVLDPRTAALTCLTIAQWTINGGAWDRRLVEQGLRADQAEAFADAATLLCHHLRAERIDVREATALFVWADQQTGHGYVDDATKPNALLPILRRELAQCPSPILLGMVRSLDATEVDRGLGGRQFACLLDLAQLGNLMTDLDAESIVRAYVGSLVVEEHHPAAHRIGSASAALLSRLSQKTPELRAQFLRPIDVRAVLANLEPDANPYAANWSLARGLRAHIRILCRAVLGGPLDVDVDMVEALARTIRSAALDHPQKGRVAAFTPHHENSIGGWVFDRPLADDLAAVLARLGGAPRTSVLNALLQTDEALILAQLLSRVEPRLQPAISQRLAELAPENAGRIHSLPEILARIDELLKAGAADAAARYMVEEGKLQTLGKPAGRELTRFRNELRLAYLRQDWAAITGAVEPTFTAQLDREAAQETLQQFRGLVALKGPNPNFAIAKDIFARLFDKRPSLGFATNWLAAAVSEVSSKDSFGLLDGPQLRAGGAVVAEAERMLAAVPGETADDTFNINLALLLLALGQSDKAVTVVSTITAPALLNFVAALRAVALARQGRLGEATATLDAAEQDLGSTEVLAAARKHIASGVPYLAAPTVSVFDDLRTNVADAIARFRLMNPTDQAHVLAPAADPLTAVLIGQVRAAGDALTQLVPMMKDVKIDSVEDDLNALMQRLLGARVEFMGWSVQDQSKGGFSEAGNAGERDILISREGSLLAVIEALVCDKPLSHAAMKANLESHFQKLVGYAQTPLFFHLTYAYGADLASLLTFLEDMAETTSPPGFAFRGRESIPHQDSRPTGFVARYDGDFGEVKVVFLILNMGQLRQRSAAKTAGATKGGKAFKAKRP